MRVVLGATLALMLVCAKTPASAQAYPTKPITIVVPLAAGTGMDTIARFYGEQLSQALGKPVVIENKPGAALMLAPAAVAAAPADGYTLLVGVTGHFATLPVLYKKVNYDADKDFVPISIYLKSPFVLVADPALPLHSAADFLALVKASKPPLTYSTPGVGTMQHLAVESIKQQFGLDLVHVPYRNTSQSVTDIVAGHVSTGVAEVGASVPLIREGKLRALAVTSSNRLSALPDVPTFAEAANAPGFEAVSWHALVAPAGTPKPIVDRLHQEMRRIMGTPEMAKRIVELGLLPAADLSLDEIEAYIKADKAKWGAVVRALGLENSQ
jgi:tripartite-type tricarboxylate transporter receptor subunit TctC